VAQLCQHLHRSALTIGKSTPSAPAAPDPAATSAAQTASNKETALYNFGLNNPNYSTPLGSIAYNVDQSDPNAPKSSANVTLSADQQKLYDEQSRQSIGEAELATSLQNRVGDTLSQPLPTSADINALSKEAQDAYYKNETQYLDPQFKQGQEQMDAKLANQGITMGSEAYNNDQNNFARQKQAAYSNAENTAIQQGPQNASALFALNTAQRNAPLNEFNALRTGSQVSMPQFQGTNTANANPTDVMGAYNTAYQGQQNAYNQEVGSNNSTTAGIAQVGSTAAMAAIMM
jgi:hypothetical protein